MEIEKQYIVDYNGSKAVLMITKDGKYYLQWNQLGYLQFTETDSKLWKH